MRRGSASILADSGAGFSRALAGAAATLLWTPLLTPFGQTDTMAPKSPGF